MKARFRNITFINVHAPTEDKEEEKENQLKRVYDMISDNDIKIFLGDTNAKIVIHSGMQEDAKGKDRYKPHTD
jgi:hypothetical protein